MEAQDCLNILAEIDMLQKRVKKRLDKGKENYTCQDKIESSQDELRIKMLSEKIKELDK